MQVQLLSEQSNTNRRVATRCNDAIPKMNMTELGAERQDQDGVRKGKG